MKFPLASLVLFTSVLASASPVCGRVTGIAYWTGAIETLESAHWVTYGYSDVTLDAAKTYKILDRDQQKAVLTTAMASGLKVCLDVDTTPQRETPPVPLFWVKSSAPGTR